MKRISDRQARPDDRPSRSGGRAAVARRHGAARPDALLSRRLGGDGPAARVRQRLAGGLRRRRGHAVARRRPALLCAAASLFAIWQICLIAMAARRTAAASIAAAAFVAAAVSIAGDRRAASMTAPCRRSPNCGPSTPATKRSTRSPSRSVPTARRSYVDGTYGTGSDRRRATRAGQESLDPSRRAGRSRRTHRHGLRDQPHDPQPPAGDAGR